MVAIVDTPTFAPTLAVLDCEFSTIAVKFVDPYAVQSTRPIVDLSVAYFVFAVVVAASFVSCVERKELLASNRRGTGRNVYRVPTGPGFRKILSEKSLLLSLVI